VQCNYRFDGARDQMPMNCLSWSAAVSFCRFDGGRLLPSEAQWEYASSGRGEERT
jgi:formylglycine-generating enzyme required for sulfatase activity